MRPEREPGALVIARAVEATRSAPGTRWLQAGAVGDELAVIARVVDHGTTGSALVTVSELATGRTVLEHAWSHLAPSRFAVARGFEDDVLAHVSTPPARLRFGRALGRSGWELVVHLPGHAITLALTNLDPSLPLHPVNAQVDGLLVRGAVRLRSESRPLDGARGFLELDHAER